MSTKARQMPEEDLVTEAINFEAILHQKGVDCAKDAVFTINFESIDEGSFAVYKIHIEGALFCTIYVSDDDKLFVKEPMRSAILLENEDSICIGNQIRFEVFENRVALYHASLNKGFYIKRKQGIEESDQTFFENCKTYHGRVPKSAPEIHTEAIQKMTREKLFFATLKEELEAFGLEYMSQQIDTAYILHRFAVGEKLSYINLIIYPNEDCWDIEYDDNKGCIKIITIHKSMISEWIMREIL